MKPRSGVESFVCCGVRIDAIDAHAATEEILKRAGAPCAVHLCNAYTLSIATKDHEFAAVLERGDLNLPDGMPLVWIARRLGLPLADRAYGPDVMANVLDRGREEGVRHYLYGSSPEVIAALGDRIETRWPGAKVVGAESPPFRHLTATEATTLVKRINTVSPDVVWIGLGTPNQDYFVDNFRDQIEAPLVAVGAAFEFHAGTKKQAPRPVQRAGMEWFWRLASEPRRLAKRYMVGNVRFVLGARGARRLQTPGCEQPEDM